MVNGANPILYLVRGDGFRFLADFGDKILFPLFRTSFIKDSIFGGQLEHPFGQDVVYQIVDMLFPFLVVNLVAIIGMTVVPLHESVLVQVVSLFHPCLGDLKNLAVHDFEI